MAVDLVVGVVVAALGGALVGVWKLQPWLQARSRRGKVAVAWLDRDRRDWEIRWLPVNGEGDVEMRNDEGEMVRVPVSAEHAWTFEGGSRSWLIDGKTKMPMKDTRSEGGDPAIEPPETVDTLTEWALGVAERNFFRGEPEGLAAVLGKHMPIMVLGILVLVIGLVAMVGITSFGGGLG